MKNPFVLIFSVILFFLLISIALPVNALADPIPKVSASIYYPDTCNPEFSVEFEISNLGSPSNSDSYLAISLSPHLNFVNWYTTPYVSDTMIRIFEIGDQILNIYGSPIETENVIIKIYNHPFKTGEILKVTIDFELTLYQSSKESIKYNEVMYPQDFDSQSYLLKIIDPLNANITNQQGYPVHELEIPLNSVNVESDSEGIEVIPEFPSLIIIPIFLITFIATIYRKLLK